MPPALGEPTSSISAALVTEMVRFGTAIGDVVAA